MNCGFSVRLPSRRSAAAGRLARALCLAALALALSAGPASAYTCGSSAVPARTLSAHVAGSPETDCNRSARRAVRKADPLSFAFFIGLLIAVVLVPIAISRREDASPE